MVEISFLFGVFKRRSATVTTEAAKVNDMTEALNRVEAKLTRLQAQLADMAGRREDPHYMLGWAEGGIKAALVEISVWREA
jgi:hypothetical protein